MTRIEEEIEALEGEIAKLRAIGTAEARRYADDLEVRVVVLRTKASNSMELLTIERLREWCAKILKDVSDKKKPSHDIRAWPMYLRAEMFEALQVAWAACRFRARDAAEMLGVPYGTLLDWIHTDEWTAWQDEHPRRESQVKAIADMAMQRAASILALETDDPKVLQVQSVTIRTVLTAGLTVAEQVPTSKPSSRNPGRPRQGLPSPASDKVPAKRSFEKAKK